MYTLLDVFPERCVISRDFFFFDSACLRALCLNSWFSLFCTEIFRLVGKVVQKKSLKYCMSATEVSKMVSKQKVNKSQKFVDFQMFVFKKNNLFFCVMFSSTWQEGWPSLPSLC